MTWSVPAPEQTLLSPWPTQAVISQDGPWELTAVAFPKQITAAFGNILRPRDLALTKTRARAAAANALANALPECVCLCVLIFFFFFSCVWVYLCLLGLMWFLFVLPPPPWMVRHSDAPVSLCLLLSSLCGLQLHPICCVGSKMPLWCHLTCTQEKKTQAIMFLSALKKRTCYTLDQYSWPKILESLRANGL